MFIIIIFYIVVIEFFYHLFKFSIAYGIQS